MDKITLIHIQQLSFTYLQTNTCVFRDFNLRIVEGEITCLIGPSGSGKSTLLDILLGFQMPSSGHIAFSGSDGLRPLISVIFQDNNIFPWLSNLENITLAGPMQTKGRKEREDCALNYLRSMELEEYASYYPTALSGGQKQKLILARTLAMEAKMLVMDEAFNSLDSITRESIYRRLLKLRAESKLTMLLVTHDLDECLWLSDTVVVITEHKPTQIREEIRIDRGTMTHEEFARSTAFQEYRQQIFRLLEHGGG
jgi:NitT/TauT family transport system ATP-binding protein